MAADSASGSDLEKQLTGVEKGLSEGNQGSVESAVSEISKDRFDFHL